MPVHVILSDDKRYLIYNFEEPLKIGELLEAYQVEREYRDSIPYILHSIIDLSGVRGIPRNWLIAKAGPGLTHPRSGEILIFGISHPIHVAINTILKITRYERMRFFSTQHEALEHLRDLIARTEVPTN